MDYQSKSSRFSTLNVFGKFSSSKPPPPPPKDFRYLQSSASTVSLTPSHTLSYHAASIGSSSHETLSVPPQTPMSLTSRSQYDLRSLSPTPSTSTMMPAASLRSTNGTVMSEAPSTFRKGISKLQSSFGRRPKLFMRSNASRTTLQSSDSSFVSVSEDGVLVDSPDGDEGISRPMNIKHNLHVDEGLANLPLEWMNQLRAQGYSELDLLSTQSRRNRTTYLLNHPDLTPDSRSGSPFSPSLVSPISPSTLLPPSALPQRSTSLRRPPRDDTSTIRSATSVSSGSPPVSSFTHNNYQSSLTTASASPLPSPSPSQQSFSTSPLSFTSSAPAARPGRAASFEDFYDDPPPSPPGTPPRQTVFRVTNMSPQPPSPPPAYGPADHARRKEQGVSDQKVVAAPGPSSRPEQTRRDVVGRKETRVRERVREIERRREEQREGKTARAEVRRSSSDHDLRSEETVTLHGRKVSPSIVPPQPSRIAVTVNDDDDDDDRPLGSGKSSQNRLASASSVPPSQSFLSTRENEDRGLPATPPTSPQHFQPHLSTLPRNGTPSPPPLSPVPRATVLPPRLSLHADMDSDLSSWSDALFSVMNSDNLSTSTSIGTLSKGSPVSNAQASTAWSSSNSFPISADAKLATPKKRTVPPLVLSSPSPSRSVINEADESVDPTTPLFDEVMSLIQSPVIDASALLAPTRPSSTYLASPPLPVPSIDPRLQSQFNFEFLKHKYNPENRNSDLSLPSSRDSQATISGSSRWSKATIRDATIARATKPAIANASAVPAPSRHVQQPSTSTVGDVSTDNSADSSFLSPLSPSALDFPMPPPSPNDATFGFGSGQSSPMLPPSTPVDSVRASTSRNGIAHEYGSGQSSPVLPPSTPVDPVRASMAGLEDPLSLKRHAPSSSSVNRLPSPSSTRSSQSSGSGSSTSSSQVTPLSVASCSESSNEGPDEEEDTISRLSEAVRVELRCTASEGNYLSPTDSEGGSRKWAKEQSRHINMSKAEPSEEYGYYDHEEGAPPVLDWLTDSPTSPDYEMHGHVKRDSVAVYNHLQRESSLQLTSGNQASQVRRPSVQINGTASLSLRANPQKLLSPSPVWSTPSPSSTGTSPLQRYRGWVSEILAPLEEFINHTVDPRDMFHDMQEIAEGESGSVYGAKVVARLKGGKKGGAEPVDHGAMVAIKNVPLVPGGSPKLLDLRKELMLMSRIRHENILSMDGLYVDLVEDSLWIEMELMERSLADVLALAEEGLILLEPIIARLTKDMLDALTHLETLGIAHRDVRSDNLLVNSQGVLKLADFSHALQLDSGSPMCTEAVGVVYWQAPEMRSGPYDARKVDVWSLGATVWELAETEPPFIDIEDPRLVPDQWPELSQPEVYSRSFHDFLSSCSSPPSSRPTAHDLSTTPFVRSACHRHFVIKLLSQCKDIEERIHRRQSTDSQGTILS